MAKRPTVPQFGNWEGENNLPYTIYFDEARKAKNGGKMMNPNDPMEYPGMFPSSPKATPSTARNAPQEPIGRRPVRPTTVDSQSRENGDMKKFNDGPLSNDNQRPVVPQFGNWDGDDNIPYTIYFDEARKSKLGGKMMNPNDPMEYPGMFSSPQATPPRAKNVVEEPKGKITVRPTTVESQSGKNKDRKRFTDNDNVSRGIGSPHHDLGGSGPGSDQARRQNVGLVQSIDRSPLHPQFQGQRNEKSSGSPARENKRPTGSSNATPGRSRMKPVSTGVQYPEKGAAVPRFGEWDEKNPASGDNYTHAFNIVRREKISGSPMVPNVSAEQAHATRQKQNGHNKHKWQNKWFPCFGK